MWYLIIPPIVIIISILFVLWYLSRKGADPFIVRKISQLEDGAEQKVSFPHTKKFFLRILEKTAYRFKVRLLQMHNIFNDVTQSLKEKRKHFQEKEDQGVSSEPHKEAPTASGGFSTDDAIFEKQKLRNPQFLEVSEIHQSDTMLQSKKFEAEEIVTRPMVSEKMVHPEVPYQKTSADIIREEGLIARIAVNPKDFIAYEELGDHYLEIGNVKDAKECYWQVLKLSPAERMAKIKIRRLEKMFLQKEQ